MRKADDFCCDWRFKGLLFLFTDMDLQHPKEVFKGIIDLSPSLRQELTSLLLDMLTTSRDFEILSTHVVGIMHVVVQA